MGIMSEEGRQSTHMMRALVTLVFLVVLSSTEKIGDRQVIKREIFLQRLASKLDSQTGTRMKRDIISIHSPPAPIPNAGEDRNQSSTIPDMLVTSCGCN